MSTHFLSVITRHKIIITRFMGLKVRKRNKKQQPIWPHALDVLLSNIPLLTTGIPAHSP